MSTPATRFTMLGDQAGAVCEGDSCLVPDGVHSAPVQPDAVSPDASVHIEPSPAEAAAASGRAVTAALDEGASL